MLNNKKYGFEFWAQLNEIEKIKKYIEFFGYYCVSDKKSNNQIYSKNDKIINFKRK